VSVTSVMVRPRTDIMALDPLKGLMLTDCVDAYMCVWVYSNTMLPIDGDYR
jgi:hypothetical protein